MTLLDRYVDELEHAIDIRGVQAVDPREIAPSPSVEFPAHLSRSLIVVEMLRVWMEHRWSAGSQTSTEDCLSMFPDISFTTRDIAELESEESRQRALHINKQGNAKPNGNFYPGQPLFPNIGEKWCGFELIAILGTGAIAQVYLAKQPDLAGRLVALKLTHRESFESYWLATLQHSAIVPIYSTHVEGELYGICMPYLGNTTLQDVTRSPWYKNATKRRQWWRTVKSTDPIEASPIASTIRVRNSSIDTIFKTIDEPNVKGYDESNSNVVDSREIRASGPIRSAQPEDPSRELTHERLVLEIGLKLSNALSHAHRAGIIHSDIKPANVLLSNDGEPRLIDFNVSYRQKSTDPQESEPLGGTLPYMSPELKLALRDATGNDITVDHRTDIFSLGMVMIELLCGQLLTERDFSLWKTKHHWSGNISPALSAILQKCVAEKVTDRYATAQQLSDDLRAQLEWRPLVHTPEPSWTERSFKWAYRHPRIASGATCLIASLVVMVAMTFGIVTARAALAKSNWQNRLSQIEAELPNALSLITSLDVVPELETDASIALNKTIALASSLAIENQNQQNKKWIWISGNERVPAEIQAQWMQLLYFAKSRQWSQSPAELESIPSEEWEFLKSAGVASHDLLLKSVQAGHYADAIVVLREQVRINPRDYFAWWLLGDCYMATQEWAQAEQAYTVCTLLRPEIAVVYFNRGIARFALQRFVDADMDYQHTLYLSPQWHTCRLNRALCLQALGQFQEALRELDTAIRNDYRTVSVYRLQSMLYEQIGDMNSRKLAMDHALKESPTTEAQWIDRGLLELGIDPRQSVESFNEALKLNPRSSDARQKLAYVHSELLGDLPSSLVHLDALVDMFPQLQTHRAGRAVVHARLGRIQEALGDVADLEKLPGLEVLVRYQIACVYSLLGRHATRQNDTDELSGHTKNGLKWLRNATLIDPSFIDIANSDPDLEWLRESPAYSQWIELVTAF
ncbi:MAG: serine/threonine-protein kinase [Pirellula sp.]|jgi:serine/threonine protein kinase|nr:serine/threonine-protein kinase [Pirellula sp.]